METKTPLPQLEEFRQAIYANLNNAADATFELIDALASQTTARSPVELSLEAVFRRGYGSIYPAIAGFCFPSPEQPWSEARREQEKKQLRLLSSLASEPQQRPFRLFVTDATSNRRQYARTLEDRGYVYAPNQVAGNKPVTIGHSYSLTVSLPEKEAGEPVWALPLIARRISTSETETEVAAANLEMLFGDESLPWHGGLNVQGLDSRYSIASYLYPAAQYDDLVTITRVRPNRVFYRKYRAPAGRERKGAGAKRYYGERFALNDPQTWHTPDEELTLTHTTKRGRVYTVKVQSWGDMLMRGKRDAPMRYVPFTLNREVWYDEQGQPVYKNPLWTIVVGKRRAEISLLHAHDSYRRRSDIEHFIRFGKQRLLLDAFQTPVTEREENWWQLVMLAAALLFAARYLAVRHPRPWERYLPRSKKEGIASPSEAQRDFGRIIREFGTPAKAPKPRKNSPGRAKGATGKRRKRLPVVKKRE